jgi:outer membrane lipoprotein-sorting protein
MISGRDVAGKRRFLGFLTALGMGLLAASASAADVPGAGAAWGITQLMSSLKQVKAASAQFVDRKTLQVLNQPLVVSGTLLYLAPDQLEKITILPKRERVAIEGDKLTIEGGAEDQIRTLSLTDYPEIAALVEGIRATLAGDLPRLSELYAIELTGSAAAWELRLQPKNAELRDFVKSILIAGAENRIVRVATESGNGDRSDMSVAETIQ